MMTLNITVKTVLPGNSVVSLTEGGVVTDRVMFGPAVDIFHEISQLAPFHSVVLCGRHHKISLK